MRNFFNGTHRRPTWRKAGRHEGFRQVGFKPRHLKRLSRRYGQVWIPKVGWVRFRWTRDIPDTVKSYRVTLDRSGRWHIAFAAIPESVPDPMTAASLVLTAASWCRWRCPLASCCVSWPACW